ncbi:hypothetical protein BGZ76_008033 [Entomortierella beljakovae]|nr:hypothetical protein BGZ76_008033 [Entomortierella beljakovae]
MIHSTTKTLRITGIVFATLVGFLFLRAIFRSSNDRPSKIRIEEPVVVILVHPSPSLSKLANFELKRAIASTWAKDVEDYGASVYFVGEHEGETVMRRPSEFEGRAQSLSSKPGSGSSEKGPAGQSGYSKEDTMRKMLIPSVLENGRADNPSGYLKAYHFLYNNTNWYAGPIFHTHPFILTTDTTHYIHVQNLATTLLSSKPRRLLTMKDDILFSGQVSEASECSAEDFGDKAPFQGNDDASKSIKGSPFTHWTLSRTHLVSKQLVAMVGPHFQYCINDTRTSSMDSSEAFQSCIKHWTSNPLFWKNGYCGRFAALRYLAPASANSNRQDSYNKIQRRSDSDGVSEAFRAGQRDRQVTNSGDSTSQSKPIGKRELSKRALKEMSPSSDDTARWIIASGLTHPEDFTLLYDGLSDEKDEEEDE